jgi:hypothetical protein
MSVYQYYEFQAIDRPLTPEEQEAVASLSSRVEPHPRRAVFTYSWSDFRGDPGEVLAKYYDAMLYMTNWGSTQLLFRFPRSAIDLDDVRAYCQPRYVVEFVSWSPVDEYVVLDIDFREEEGNDWIEGEGWLDSVLPLRDDILRGDYRALYLAWLGTLGMEDVLPSVVEPPVPPGLGKLTPALRRFVELFKIDNVLVEVAAEASGGIRTTSDAWTQRAISRLSRDECDAFLLRLTQGELHLGLALRTRLREVMGPSTTAEPTGEPRRTVGQLLAETERRREQEQRRRAEEAERKRVQGLEALAKRQAETWWQVDTLIKRMTGSAYAEAVQLLVELRDLAEYKGQMRGFEERLDELCEQYSRRTALIRRLREAGLR